MFKFLTSVLILVSSSQAYDFEKIRREVASYKGNVESSICITVCHEVVIWADFRVCAENLRNLPVHSSQQHNVFLAANKNY